MKHINTPEEYARIKKDVTNRGLVVHFSAAWCEPCKSVTEALQGYSERYRGFVAFAEVDSEALCGVCEDEAIDCVPFIAFFRISEDGKEQERVANVVGGKLDQVELNMLSLYGDGVRTKESFSDLQSYLKYLTNRPGVVVFITGTPSRPRCGFTDKLIQLLDSLDVRYIYYDILACVDVCEGLKKFSDWPTYPQVYSDGEFVGGYDICAELNASGQLKRALKL